MVPGAILIRTASSSVVRYSSAKVCFGFCDILHPTKSYYFPVNRHFRSHHVHYAFWLAIRFHLVTLTPVGTIVSFKRIGYSIWRFKTSCFGNTSVFGFSISSNTNSTTRRDFTAKTLFLVKNNPVMNPFAYHLRTTIERLKFFLWYSAL